MNRNEKNDYKTYDTDDCNHSHVRSGFVTDEYYGYEFKAKGDVCTQCGAESWTPDLIFKFEAFKNKIANEHKDKFKVQKFGLTEFSAQFIASIASEFNIKRSHVVRSLLATYFNVIKSNESHLKIFRMTSFANSFPENFSGVRLNRKMFDEVSRSSIMLKMPMNIFVCQIVNRMTLLVQASREQLAEKRSHDEWLKSAFQSALDAA